MSSEAGLPWRGARPSAPGRPDDAPMLRVQRLGLNLGGNHVLRQVDLALPRQGVTCLIGPSGAGKSSLLRCINGLYREWQGRIDLDGWDIRDWQGGWDQLRRRVGLIAQRPCVFPGSVRANVLFGLSRRQRRSAGEKLRHCLRQAALWEEVERRLDSPAATLSIGQQQRLCIARALIIEPQLLLLDEPTAALDPRSKQLIEQSISQLAQRMPVLCVTHDLAQAQRLGGQVVFLCEGRVIERGECASFFQQPQALETREFLRWSVCECSGEGAK